MIYETILKNSDSIKIIDKEMEKILNDKNKKDISKQEIHIALSKLNEEILIIKELDREHKPSEEILPVGDKNKKRSKFKYYNVGCCKYKVKCKFTHPTEVCKDNVGSKCEDNKCPSRHPKAWKWFTGSTGCRRNESCHFFSWSKNTLTLSDMGWGGRPTLAKTVFKF